MNRKNYRRDVRVLERRRLKEINIKDITIERLRNGSVFNDNGCWIWNRRKNPNGYGQTEFKVDGGWKQISVHRLSAHLFLDLDIKSELHVLHKVECLSRACWNPNHLYIGNQSDNSKDAVKTKTHNMTNKSMCDKGHPLDGLKFSSRDGYVRYCKECSRQSSKRRRKTKNA